MNNRKHERLHPLVIRTKFTHGDRKMSGYLTNISVAGAFLHTEERIPNKERLSLRVSLPWQIGDISVEAIVEWDNFDGPDETPEQPSGVGLSFLSLNEGARQKIVAFIERFHALVAQLEDQPQ